MNNTTPEQPSSPDATPTVGAPAAEQERTVLGLIRALQGGELLGAALSTPDRRRVIEHLWTEGYSVPETAEVIKISERTVQRDRKSIREANAVQRTPALVSETVGALLRQAEAVVGRLRRISRERDTLPPARIDAEKACWVVTKELAETLQSLGYLPTAAQEFKGQVTHSVIADISEMHVQVLQLEQLITDVGVQDPVLLQQLTDAKQELARLSLAGKIGDVALSVAKEAQT
jgi:DNA-binding CsgD family transcriptional regulator